MWHRRSISRYSKSYALLTPVDFLGTFVNSTVLASLDMDQVTSTDALAWWLELVTLTAYARDDMNWTIQQPRLQGGGWGNLAHIGAGLWFDALSSK